MRRFALAAVAAAFLVSAPAHAQVRDWSFDATHTQIHFQVSHFGLSMTQGQFRRFETELKLDPAAPQTGTVRFTVDAASVDTNFEPRDNHLRTRDFLNVAAHPQIRFESREIVRIDDKTATVRGDFTLLGQTKPVEFRIVLTGRGPNPAAQGRETFGFLATGTIKRSEFGMTFGVPAIGDDVQVAIHAEAFVR